MGSKLSTGEGNNPIVLGTFEGTKGDKPRPRILFYGSVNLDPSTLSRL